MTGPAAGDADRGASAPTRTSTTRGPASAIVILLALGLALRVIIAYLLPGSGFGIDLNAFAFWANDLAKHGPVGFYDRGFFADYTPGYLYVLWLVGLVGQAIGGIGDLIKVPAMLSDLAVAYLVYSMVLEAGGTTRRALLGAGLFLFLPITWFDSTIWGQVDSFGVVFLLLGLRALWRDRPEWAAFYATVAAVTKPQLGILLPILAAVLIRRHLIDRGRVGTATGPERGPLRVVTSASVSLVTASLLSLPFGLSIVGLFGQVVHAAGGYPYLSVNAYNPWALLSLDGNGIAANGTWVNDIVVKAGDVAFTFGPIPAIAVGTGLLLLTIGAICFAVARRPDRLTILVGLAVMAVAFFVVPTRVHERYLFPFIPLGAILAALSARWWIPFLAITTANFFNLYVVLTSLYPGNPGIQDWLGLGSTIRSWSGVAAIAGVHLVVFAWVALQLRRPAVERLGDEVEAIATDEEVRGLVAAGRGSGALGRPAVVGVGAGPGGIGRFGGARRGGSSRFLSGLFDRPAPEDPGTLAAIRRRLFVRPVRADRTGSLAHESGGRFDRLDIWIVVVLAIAVLALRMFRLAEPLQMHFDEVYHARTATEFLQDWRYGEPHTIYEYTHPHLAKYAMAAGIVAFADDQVTATSDLGTPVRASLVEPRWDDPRLPAARAGDRLYVATGSEMRVYDLATRNRLATLALPGASALALDTVGHRLFVGTDSGTVSVIDTSAFDDQRVGAPPPGREAVAAFSTVGSGVTRLFATGDGRYVLVETGAGDLVSIRTADAVVTGTVHLASAAGMADAGSVDTLVAHPGTVADPTAAVRVLVTNLGGQASTYEALLASKTDPVIVGPAPSPSARDALNTAITNGGLAGFEFLALPEVAVGTPTGIAFVAPASGAIADTIVVDGGVTGMAATSGLDAPRIYAAGGSAVTLIDLPKSGDTSTRPAVETRLTMPGAVRDVTYDPSSLMVHVLGRTSDGASSTIYVIEPHGNAVYADARLPFDPATWATDVAPAYPAADRQEILAFSPTGAAATVDVGSHAFAWRLPGVLLGVLTAVALYLLTRILFRRRLIAVLAGVLSLADGMLFVQSRIGMNDVYVGFFIIAAYALFAGLWTGRWRQRWAFWALMPVIGVLLGLACASKWVGLYAIGAVGVLILARSALGRTILIAGLLGAAAVLGYMGLVVPAGGTSGGNLIFMLVMIALSLAAIAVSVLHPIAWSLEEMRFAVGAPLAAGIGVLLVALPLGLVGSVQCAPGGTCAGPIVLEVAFGLVALAGVAAAAFALGGRLGIGPLARGRRADAGLASAEPPAPAPAGWLRPGWAFGLPVAWMIVCLAIVPLAVYVISYLPWVALGNRLTDSWPAGNTGQTLADLTGAMYRYHNDLRFPHPASSPWWAWPFDLKPVWFYQGSFAGSSAAAIYDAGNIVVWWLSVPALAFTSWQAYRRRSLGLALITIGYACQWVPWIRIDRATFQYHYYTSVPFLIVALAYFLAELWHGPSARTWLLARVAAALAILSPALMWLFRTPFCAFARAQAGWEQNHNSGPSLACTTSAPGQIVVTAQTAGLIVIMGVAILVLLWQLARLGDGRGGGEPPGPRLRAMGMTALLTVVGVVLVGRLPEETVLFSLVGFSPEALSVGLLVPLGLLAWFVVTARDSRRFVVGALYASIMWFVIWYPNIAALPVPAAFVNAYQGLIPTYLYPFQFPVNTDPPAVLPHFLNLEMGLLVLALLAAAAVVAYSAWTWRSSVGPRGDDAGEDRLLSTGDPA